ncbi:AAA family ATPase [Wolbachia endosymbiont of Bemisia tabaci]|uniref:AAA family ATPase n=1 Tax=Wolbachia endosymbiont of Bemisia tabaci TaxID=215173 RepID=UPI000D54E35A|nr:AAA family ATPase [Wolbachia endosymbiont of Bemisia tabaci]
MENTNDRGNTLPFIAGTLATLTLLASGVFAIAPYVEFLSPIVVLGISLPITLIISLLSIAVIAFTYKIISKNKKLDEASKQTNSPVIKDEVEKRIKNLEESNILFNEKLEVLANTTTTSQMKEELYMKFYEKGEVRGNKPFEDFILEEHKREELSSICKLIKDNISKMSLEKTGNSEEKRKVERVGCILYGPPGTGKTSISKAIANQTKSLFAFMSVSASCLSSQRNIDQVFEKAETNSPCMIFIDEIDGVGKKRTVHEDAGPLTYLLTKLDKEFLSSKNITVVAATNHKNHLDPALIRGGRLECIEVPGLDKDDTRQKILQERLEKLKDSDMKILVQASKGFSMANLICLIDKISETTEKEGEIKYLRTFCKNFKKKHNIKDEPDKKHSNGKTKNKYIRLSSGSLSRSSSVSS